VYKSPPYYPQLEGFDPFLSFSEEDMELWEELGMNLMRLGVMWPGVEPREGLYDMQYIATMQGMVRNASAHGIYTLVDGHQDGLAECFCGEGIPDWAIRTKYKNFPSPVTVKPFTRQANGRPSREDCLSNYWPTYYISFEEGNAWQSFYDNVDGMQDSFARHWELLAKSFRGEDSVLAFELINEPWAGDVLGNPLYILPGYATRQNIEPMAKKVAAGIREIDPTRLLVFDTVTWAHQFGMDGALIGTGFHPYPLGEESASTAVLGYHYYKAVVQGQLAKIFAAYKADADRVHAGLLLTEFEVEDIDPDHPLLFYAYHTPVMAATAAALWTAVFAARWWVGSKRISASRAHMSAGSMLAAAMMLYFSILVRSPSPYGVSVQVMNECDRTLQSWTAWEYKTFAGHLPNGTCTGCGPGLSNPDGSLNTAVAAAVSRTYPQAVAGITKEFDFNPTTRRFQLTYAPTFPADPNAPTEVYLNEKIHYPNGYSVTTEPLAVADISFDHNRVLIHVHTQVESLHVEIKQKTA